MAKLQRLKRLVISLVLFILPVKMSYMFLEVALPLLLVKTRNKKASDIDMVKFFKLVNSNYNESIVDLPYYSVSYIWPEEYLDSKGSFTAGKNTVREVITDNKLLKNNITRLVDSMLSNLPFLMRIKLGLGSEIKRKELRNEIVRHLESKIKIAAEVYKDTEFKVA